MRSNFHEDTAAGGRGGRGSNVCRVVEGGYDSLPRLFGLPVLRGRGEGKVFAK